MKPTDLPAWAIAPSRGYARQHFFVEGESAFTAHAICNEDVWANHGELHAAGDAGVPETEMCPHCVEHVIGLLSEIFEALPQIIQEFNDRLIGAMEEFMKGGDPIE